jgi:hypothetical protein
MADRGMDLTTAIVLDTGCTQHMFRKRDAFIDLRLFTAEERVSKGISGIGKSYFHPMGEGTVSLTLFVRGEQRILKLRHVLYMPELQTNLVSGSQLVDAGCKLELDVKNSCILGPRNGDCQREVISEAM